MWKKKNTEEREHGIQRDEIKRNGNKIDWRERKKYREEKRKVRIQ